MTIDEIYIIEKYLGKCVILSVKDGPYIFDYYTGLGKHLKEVGLKIHVMNSGTSVFVYCRPTNELHPYDRYLRGELTMLQVYDMAIGNYCMFTNEVR